MPENIGGFYFFTMISLKAEKASTLPDKTTTKPESLEKILACIAAKIILNSEEVSVIVGTKVRSVSDKITYFGAMAKMEKSY